MEKKSKKLSGWFVSRPKTSGFIFFLVMLVFLFLIVNQRYNLFKENKERNLTNILDAVKENLNQSLKSSYTVALTLALTIDNDGVSHNFNEVSSELIKSNKGLKAVQLVPNGIVKYVYPLKGNEPVLNLDIFGGSKIMALEARKAISLRKMYFQGPVKLTQGGVGVIGRLPLFINNNFWGFSAVVIELDTLLKTAGINNDKYSEYQFQFSKVNSITHKEEFFLPMPKNFNSALSKSITFPDGDWKVYVVNTNKYDTWYELVGAILFGLGTAVLSSVLITRVMRKQAQLQEMIDQQTTKIIDTESKFKNIFDYAAVGIARINSLTGQILEVNPYFCNFLGYSEAELFNMKIKSIIYPDDLGDDGLFFKQLMSGKIRQFNKVKRYVNKDGNIIWGNVIITPLWDEGEEPTNHIVIIEDVTKRKEEEEILISSQRRIESLINTIDGIVWEGNEDQTYTFISNKVEDILGYTPEEWTTIPNFWFDHLHPDDKEWVKLYILKATEERRQRDFEYRMIASDGEIVWIRDIVAVTEEANKPIKLRGIMIDITSNIEVADSLNKSFKLVTEQNKRLLNFSYIVSHNLRSHASNILGISALIESAKTVDDRNEMIQLLKTVAGNLNETLLNLNNIVNIQTSIDIIVEPLNLYDYIITTLNTQNAQMLAKEATVINNVDKDIFVNFNRAYLESILLNLLSNALRYSKPDEKPVVSFSCVDERGQLVLKVCDNGVGIDLAKHGDKMFGIYQTFNGNSDARGFGLFISKNQIEAMGGRIEVESTLNKGTTFKIYFK